MTSDNPIEEIDASSFAYYDEDDSYVYHVTSSDRVSRIVEEGFDTSSKMMAPGYHGYSEDRVFFTEKSGVMFWKSRVEDRLFDQFDDPPEVAVIRVSRNIVASALIDDKVGTADAKHPAYFASVDVANRALLGGGNEINSPLDHTLGEDFYQWFDGSKVCQDDGKPRLLFHGTNASFREFDMSSGWFGDGAYFTDDPEVASDYVFEDEPGGNVIPVYLRLVNPYVFVEKTLEESSNVQMMRELGMSDRKISSALKNGESESIIKDLLEEQGYDGVIAHQQGEPVEYVAFSPDQIKFAIAHDWNSDLQHHASLSINRKFRP